VKPLWKKVRHRVEWAALHLSLKLIPRLSRRACSGFARFAGAVVGALDRRGRRVALANLEAVFGDELTSTRRTEIVRESYQHFAGTIIDLLWSPQLNNERFAQYFEFEGFENIGAQLGPSGSCIVGTFHYGSFEMLGLATAWLGYPCAITTEELKNPLLNDVIAKLRQQTGHVVVDREGAIVRLYKTLRRNGRVALLVDTTLPPQQPAVVIDCFGLKTSVTVAHAWLQDRTGLPIIPVHCEPLPEGRYRIVAHPKVRLPDGATHRDVAQACWDAIEPIVRRNPAPWLWMYKHWRYKPRGAAGYPFYSQESRAFDEVSAQPNYSRIERSPIRGRKQARLKARRESATRTHSAS
jgi:lauroyl/myristoyl acyltransferase